MFRASSAHLQEDTVVHMQHMVLSQFLVACRYTAWVRTVLTQAVYRHATKNSNREWQYHMLHVHNCIHLKMSTWGSKHVEENIILWINNNQCIKLVINSHCIIILSSWWWAQWCPKHVKQAIRTAMKTSVASRWHFISTINQVMKIINQQMIEETSSREVQFTPESYSVS